MLLSFLSIGVCDYGHSAPLACSCLRAALAPTRIDEMSAARAVTTWMTVHILSLVMSQLGLLPMFYTNSREDQLGDWFCCYILQYWSFRWHKASLLERCLLQFVLQLLLNMLLKHLLTLLYGVPMCPEKLEQQSGMRLTVWWCYHLVGALCCKVTRELPSVHVVLTLCTKSCNVSAAKGRAIGPNWSKPKRKDCS